MDPETKLDHYAILGLPSGEQRSKLTLQEITSAYKKKALELHPDKNPNDPNANANFQQLNSSYQILKDEKESRKPFDLDESLHQMNESWARRWEEQRRKREEEQWRQYEERRRRRRRREEKKVIFEVDEREVKRLRKVRVSDVLNFVRGR